MQKFMKVTLREFRMATETEGQLSKNQEWKIPFDSLGAQKKSPLEEQMLKAVNGTLPGQYQDAVQYMLYGDFSSGGEIKHGDFTFTVEFTKF